MTDRELMQQALDALENWLEFDPENFGELDNKAITALRDRLAQPEQELVIDCPRCGHCCPKSNQEPVAWIWEYANGKEEVVFVPPHRIDLTHKDAPSTIIPLYTTPRQWVGLTDEEIAKVEDEYIVDYRIPAGSAWNFAKDIETKLKDKNT